MRTVVHERWSFTAGTALLILVCFVSVFGCGSERGSPPREADAERSEKKTLREEFPEGDYWLNIKVDQFKGSYTVLCNGFPVKRMWINIIEADDEWAADMQTALIGEGNVASIRIRPFLDYSGKRLTVGPAQLRGWVEIEETRQSYVPLHKIKGAEREGHLRAEAVDSAHAAWKEQVQKQWETLLKEKSTRKKAFVQLKTWRWENPIEVRTTPFENRHGPDFSRVFEEAPRLEDTPATRRRLKDYAMRLRDLLKAKEVEGFYQEMKLRMHQRGKAPKSKEHALQKLRGSWLFTDTILDFGREEIGLRKWCDGRVWELYVKQSHDFFHTPDGSEMAAYVAEIDGELKVVR